MRDSIYQGEVNIKYIERRAASSSDVLVVVFPGRGGGGAAQSYNYLMTVSKFNVNSLYFKFGDEERKLGYASSRMTCINRDFKIERSIVELINKICKESGSKRVIAVGSSMGGWTCLYYGLKYGYEVISGSPPWSFTGKSLQYVAGSSTKEDRAWWEQQIQDVVTSAGQSNSARSIFISWGRGESLYTGKRHGQRLIAALDAANIKYTVKLYDYQDHDTVFTLFPNILAHRLSVSLGLVSDEPNEAEKSPELRLAEYVRKKYEELIIPDTLASTPPNTAIKVKHVKSNRQKSLRAYTGALKDTYWLNGVEKPVVGKGFWLSVAKLDVNTRRIALSLSLHQTILNHYRFSGDATALQWVSHSLKNFLTVIKPGFSSEKHPYKRLRPVYFYRKKITNRLQTLLDYHALASSSSIPDLYRDDSVIKNEILWCAKRYFALPPRGATSPQAIYDFSLLLLQTAVYFRNCEEFYVSACETAVVLINALTDYAFDANGVCQVGQVREQARLSMGLRNILEFMAANEVSETPGIKKLKRKCAVIEEMMARLVAPDGSAPAYGHSNYVAERKTERKAGTFIKPSSNLAVLSNDFAYLCVNGGTNIHALEKHCDLLSFQFFYDGQWLVLDTGGADSELSEFAQSSVAHSALLCDDKDYVTPGYVDWTTIRSFEEKDDYVRISMSHRLVAGVELFRTLVWLKPNVVVLYDEGESDTDHSYTQNFILPRVQIRNGPQNPTRQVATTIGDVTLTITQFNDGFILKQHDGTTNAKASVEQLRGSLISNFNELRRGTNLAYSKQTSSATFLTAITASSGRSGEVSVEKAEVLKDILVITLNSGAAVSINLKVESSLSGL